MEGWKDFDLNTEVCKFDYIKSDWDRSASSYEITFYAIWKANTYTVTYHPNGGSGTAYSIEVVYDSEFVLLDVTDSHINFTMRGHSFDRWRGSNASEWKGWVGKPWQWTYPQDVILYAQWTPNTYHVTYNSNGGTGNDYEFDIVYGETFVLLDPTDSKLNYSRAGYWFDYWSMQQDGSETDWKGWIGREWGWGYDYDVTFYAQWQPNYHVVYHANGGSGTMSDTVVGWGDSLTISACTYTKTGYKFSHWAELYPDGTYKNNGWTGWSGTWQYANGQYSISDYKLNLYAIWTPNQYTVTFNPNGGSVSPTTATVTYDSTYGTLPTPTKTGYTFAGWVGKNLFNKSATAYKTGYYVRGADGYEVGYSAYNIYEFQVPAGAKITIKNSGQSTSPGYAFYTSAGAYISGANFGNKSVVTATVPSNAMYIHVSVNVGSSDESYRIDINSFQVEIGSSATTYESYKTVTSSTKMTTAHNHTLMALWTPNTYKVTLDNQSATTAGTTAYWYKYKTYVNGKYYFSDEACTTGIGGTNGNAITKPTRKGYTFGGYFTGKNGTGTQYVDANGYCVNNIYSNVAGNTTLYAKWTEHVLTIKYHLNGGTPVSGNAYFTNADPCKTEKWSYSSSSQYGLTNCDDTARVTKTGYAAQGYYNTKADGSGANLDDDTLTTTIAIAEAAGVLSALEAGNTTLNIYMQWKPKTYTVTYEWALTNKGWMDQNINHSPRFTNWSVSGTTLSVSITGQGGWETKWLCFYGEAGHEYTWTFGYTMPSSYGMRAQILSSQPGNNNGQSAQVNTTSGSGYLDMAKGASGTATLKFTPTTTGNYYLNLNFGYLSDNVAMSLTFTNIKLQTTRTVTYDSTYSSMPTLANSWVTGYSNSKWTNSSGTTITSSTKVTTASNHTLTANLSPVTRVITFSGILGTLSTGSVDGSSWSVSSGEYVMTSAGGNGGYLSGFSGFMTNGVKYRITVQAKASKAITLPMNFEAGASKSISLTTSYQTFYVDFTYNSSAKYQALTFYSGSWASGDKLYVKDVQLSRLVTVNTAYGTLPSPTKAGYTFAGWWTTSDNSGIQITKDSICVTYNRTLYPHWTGNKYTVKFNANGGSGTMADQKFTYGTAQNLTANAFTRTGYKFTGWATSATGSKIYNDKQSVNNLTTTANGTFNLYARWDKIHKITFNKNGGTGGTSELWFYVGGSKFYTNSTCTTELPNQKLLVQQKMDMIFRGIQMMMVHMCHSK